MVDTDKHRLHSQCVKDCDRYVQGLVPFFVCSCVIKILSVNCNWREAGSIELRNSPSFHEKIERISSLMLWRIFMRESKFFKNGYTKKDARGDYSRGAGENCSR